MCDRCPKELCENINDLKHIISGDGFHIHAPCWSVAKGKFLLGVFFETGNDYVRYFITFTEAINYCLNIEEENFSLTDRLYLLKIKEGCNANTLR